MFVIKKKKNMEIKVFNRPLINVIPYKLCSDNRYNTIITEDEWYNIHFFFNDIYNYKFLFEEMNIIQSFMGMTFINFIRYFSNIDTNFYESPCAII